MIVCARGVQKSQHALRMAVTLRSEPFTQQTTETGPNTPIETSHSWASLLVVQKELSETRPCTSEKKKDVREFVFVVPIFNNFTQLSDKIDRFLALIATCSYIWRHCHKIVV